MESCGIRKLQQKRKTKTFKTIVRSNMTYGSEAWITNKHTTIKLVTAEMDFWRRSAIVSRREKIRNDVIKDRMNVKNVIADFI